ncbi:MAG: 3,4-dihydroxy-2-butanone-4-phosphate synthase [Pseudomonadota bacterium]
MKEIFKHFAIGNMLILVDDENRENEGDLVFAAEKTSPEKINFMAKHGRGLICLAMTKAKCEKLDLKPMVQDNTSSFKTAFTVSIEAKKGVTTGISAKDRATTILTAINDDAKASDLARPGHVFPLIAREGGVLVRGGQTEGSVDLARLSGLKEAAVICEIMNDDGEMARMPDLQKFSKKFNIPIVTIEQLIEYRLRTEILIKRINEKELILNNLGSFKMFTYRNLIDECDHLAFVKGEINSNDTVPVRVASECLLSDVFGDESCSCGRRLKRSLEYISQHGQGVIIYLRKPKGLNEKTNFECASLKPQTFNDADFQTSNMRQIGIGAQILLDLNVHKMHLLSSNPGKIVGLNAYGIKIEKRSPLLHIAKDHEASEAKGVI